MDTARRNREGVALLLALFIMIVILAAVGVVVYRAQSAKRFTDASVYMSELDEACKAGVDLGVERVWHQYVVGQGNTTGNLASYRTFLNNHVQPNEDVNHNGTRDGDEEDSNGNGTFDVNPAWFVIGASDAPRTLASGARITLVSIERLDEVTGSNITIRATAEKESLTRSAVLTLRIAGQLFTGFEYGILANNINCILCHAEVLPLDLSSNTDASLYDTFDRIKVAALESLMVRSGSDHFGAHSRVAGTVYTRGQVYNQSGGTYSATALASSTFKGCQISSTDGKLVQNSSGSLVNVNLANATTGTDGLLKQFSNLYLNYPSDKTLMTDGDLPTSFPSPFPDENGDRTVNDSEFTPVMNSADGAVTGGVIYGLPSGTAYSGTALPTASNSAASSLATGTYNGNLFLVGTDAAPITIDEKIAVNGDLVIAGKVKGWGQLQVRGNVYVVGDVTYADAAGKFGVAADGTVNGLALTAGGSIMIGDYLTVWAKDDKSTSDIWSEEWIDMRASTRTNSTSRGSVTCGYFDSGVVDVGSNATTTAKEACSFTSAELMLFNDMERQKDLADSSYVPRYYQIRPTQPIFRYTGSDQNALWYEDTGIETLSGTKLAGATIHSLNPKNFWISETQLRQIWYADELTRPTAGRPVQFDGLLYSNNCIFCVTHSKQYHNSNTLGKMIIRGGIIAADLGVFVPGPNLTTTMDALKVYYDRRVADFFQIEDTSKVEFSRTVFLYE